MSALKTASYKVDFHLDVNMLKDTPQLFYLQEQLFYDCE